ncbi:MAG TPA: alpha/beta fold hydrolase [Bryobacteraceae bacterium]|nr:alpha/beta fold hydrolase [Bryobacteraceae bacterium]
MRTLFCSLLLASLLPAANYPAPVEGDWTVRDFQFHSGESLPELRLHYTTVGAPTGRPVLILHGTNGSGANFLNDAFGGEMFGQGQPLDAATHYIILPDSVGSGKSSKPSDGLRAKFPHYNYDDAVRLQYRLVTEHLGIRHLGVVIGNSQGGMHAWMWGVMYPDFMDVLVPLASLPMDMSGRNWMMRRMLIDAIRNDPEYNGGNYTEQPRGFRRAQVYFGLATSGGTQAIYRAASTRAKADEIIDRQLAQRSNGDANDVLYAYEASRDYNPSPYLEKIQAQVLAINSADDERNPAELGVLERDIKRIKNGRYVLIPTSEETRGHGTTGLAKLWKRYLEETLVSAR